MSTVYPPAVAAAGPVRDTWVTGVAGTGMSWGAVLAGAVAAAALSFVLLILGLGLGLSAASPWSNRGATTAALGVPTILWLAFTQIAASGIGGYLAGRLRTRWARVHTDEVYFRDTAHGLVAWSVATLAMAALMGSAISGVLSGAGSVAAVPASAAVRAAAPAGRDDASANDTLGYWVDGLLRADAAPASASPAPADAADVAAVHAEAGRTLAHALRAGTLTPADKSYLAQRVARRTGLSQPDAEKRVSDVFDTAKKAADDAAVSARQKADAARKSTAYSALWMFVALLAGAFVACLAATLGGRRRDSAVIDI